MSVVDEALVRLKGNWRVKKVTREESKIRRKQNDGSGRMRSVGVVSSEVEVTTWASRPSSCHPTPTARLVVAATTRADPVVARHLDCVTTQ